MLRTTKAIHVQSEATAFLLQSTEPRIKALFRRSSPSLERDEATKIKSRLILEREPLCWDSMFFDLGASASYHYFIHLNFPVNSPGEEPLMKKSSALGLRKWLIFTSFSWQHRHVAQNTASPQNGENVL